MSLPYPVQSSPKSASVEFEPKGISACPVCGHTEAILYRDDNAERSLLASDLGSSRQSISHGKILRCRRCGCGFRACRPDDRELASLYRELDPAVYEREARGRLRTAQRHLEIVRRYVSRGCVIDVGCASGAFLSCAADAGFEVVGVEPSSVLCAKAQDRLGGRGTVHCCSLQDAKIEPASGDALTLWDVLEHVPDPLDFLRQCVSLVKPRGYVIANVPDLETWQARWLGRRWPLLLAEHLNYFSRKSLTVAGEAAALQTICFGRRPSSFTLEYVLYRLSQHSLPGAQIGHSFIRKTGLRSLTIPAYLGESYVVWRRPDQARRVA